MNYRLLTITLLITLMMGCGSQPAKETVQAKCDYLAPMPQPIWTTGADNAAAIPGYYIGVGASDAHDPDAHKNSRIMAEGELSSSIKVAVKQNILIATKQAGGSDTPITEITKQTETITNNALNDVTVDGRWLNRNSCQLWVRVKVSRDLVINQQLLAQAEASYHEANNGEQPLATRVQKIEQTLKQLEQVDFGAIPSETIASYLPKYRILQQQLQAQSEGNETLVVTLSKQQLSDALHKEIAYRLANGLKKSQHLTPAPCSDHASCIDTARNLGAKQLILAEASTQMSQGSMGSWQGELTLHAALYNVGSGSIITQFQNQKGQLLTFNRTQVAWEQALERLFQDNEQTMALRTTALRCTVQQC